MKYYIALLLFFSSISHFSFGQNISSELDNTDYWITNGKGEISVENNVYTLKQTEKKKFLLQSVKKVDFTKPFELNMNLKIIEGYSFYIGINADSELDDEIKIGILTYEIYIDQWIYGGSKDKKLLKKKLKENMSPRTGIGLKIIQKNSIMDITLTDMQSGTVLNYTTKPYSIKPENDNFTISTYGSSTLTTVEISNFSFNYLDTP